MNHYLPDINVWLAIAFAAKAEHSVADAWFQVQSHNSCFFCRNTQQGFLRLSTNASAVGADVKTMAEAWLAFDRFMIDPKVGFAENRRIPPLNGEV